MVLNMVYALEETVTSAAAEGAGSDSVGVSYMLRLLCGLVGILLLVYLLAEITPKLAAFIDKHLGKNIPDPERVQEKDYEVYDIYKGEHPSDASENASKENEADKKKNN